MSIQRRGGSQYISHELYFKTATSYTSLTPLFRYRADDFNITTNVAGYYGYGVNLAITAGVAKDGDFPLGMVESSFTIGAGWIQANSLTDLTISTEDFMFFAVVYVTTSATERMIFQKANAVGAGYEFKINSSHQPVVRLYTGASVTVTGSAMSVGWHMIHFFADRNEASTNGSQLFVDSIESGAGVDISGQADLTNASYRFIIGRSSGYGSAFDSNISHIACWKSATIWPGSTSNLPIWKDIARSHYLNWTQGEVIS